MTKEEQLAITKYDLLYEQRVTRVETTIENIDRNMTENFREIKTDLRWMFGLMIMITGILLGVMSKGFHWL